MRNRDKQYYTDDRGEYNKSLEISENNSAYKNDTFPNHTERNAVHDISLEMRHMGKGT